MYRSVSKPTWRGGKARYSLECIHERGVLIWVVGKGRDRSYTNQTRRGKS